MDEIVAQIREQVAYYERTHPLEDPAERREREFEKRRQEAQKVCEARKAREAETASANWYAAVDGRIHEHLKSWLWAAIDQRVVQILEQHFFSGERGVGGAVIGGLTDAVGGLIGKLKRTIEEQRRAFEGKFVALEERQALSNQAIEAHERNVAGGAQERAQLRDELKCALTEMADAFGGQIAALEQRLKATPGTLPAVKIYCPDTVHYAGHVVVHRGATYQALRARPVHRRMLMIGFVSLVPGATARVSQCVAPERMVAGGRPVEVVRMKITEAGRQAINSGR